HSPARRRAATHTARRSPLQNWLLPLDDPTRRERFDPRTLVIGALCSCSMDTACLRELANSDFDDARFAAWITANSPRARLEQIALAAGPKSFLEITKIATRRFGHRKPTMNVALELFDELSVVMLGHVPGLTAEPRSELGTQAYAAVERLRKNRPTFDFNVEEALR